MKKSIDVIIPAYKPDKTFENLISRLQKQTVKPRKILVVNTGEDYWNQGDFDKTPFLSESASGIEMRVVHVREEEYDHGGTRKMMAGMSDADILLFMTQDAMPADTHLLEQFQKIFQNAQETGIAAAYARQLPSADCHLMERYTRQFNYPPESRIKSREDLSELGIKTYFCSNVCAAYLRSVYEQLGGFEERTIFNEDMIFAGKLIQNGYKVAYAADAKVIHSHNYNGKQQFQRKFDLAVSQTEHPEIFEGIKSEKEGIRLVGETAGFLLKEGKPWMIIRLFVISACKYAGYKLGRNYQRLPKWMILKCTSNRKYWK